MADITKNENRMDPGTELADGTRAWLNAAVLTAFAQQQATERETEVQAAVDAAIAPYQTRVAALLEALRLVQWTVTRANAWVSICLQCQHYEEDGHAADCPVGRVLAGPPPG